MQHIHFLNKHLTYQAENCLGSLFSPSCLPQKTRYETYVTLLKDGGGKELLSSGENDGPGLKKCHSSPSLNQESPVSAKVKRNISERKDYRPETPSVKQKVT